MFRQPIVRSIIAAVLACGIWAGSAHAQVETSTAATAGVTLAQCYEKALKVSESLKIDEQDIRQLEALYRQGVGNVLPHISWQMTQLWQDTSDVDQSTSGVQGTLLRQRRPESYFMLEQPIFHGLRDYYAVKGIKAARKSAELTYQQATLGLLEDLANVFYVSLDLQGELVVLTTQRELTGDRLKELQRRVSLGRSRDSEVLSSQVELASLDAQMEDTRVRWMAARQTLQFLTEVPPEIPLIENAPLPLPMALKEAHDKSANRPDLRAASYVQEQERFRISYARGGYLPGVDVVGKYYTERVGFNEDVKWDAQLFVDVPIFSGFITRNEVAEAKSRLIAADLAWARLKRQIRQQVETTYHTFAHIRTQALHYGKAVELAEKNYKIQQQEYRLGLINNLQVLDVIKDMQDLKIQRIRSEAAVRLNEVRLRVAVGQGL